MITKGKHKAKVIESGLGQTNAGKPQAFLKFETEDGSTIGWYGTIEASTPEKTEKAQEITIKNLVTAGFIGNEWADLNQPLEVVFTKRDLTLVIDEEADLQGNMRLKVKYINASQGPKEFKGQAPKMGQAFAKARKEAGIKESIKHDDIAF